jgi:hypothetical protein
MTRNDSELYRLVALRVEVAQLLEPRDKSEDAAVARIVPVVMEKGLPAVPCRVVRFPLQSGELEGQILDDYGREFRQHLRLSPSKEIGPNPAVYLRPEHAGVQEGWVQEAKYGDEITNGVLHWRSR